MKRTILITGTSTGIGHAAAELFASRGWNVLAGSRHPQELHCNHPAIQPLALDPNDTSSVNRCFADPRVRDLDCIVNNAGFGLLLPFEDTPPEEIDRLFQTNVFGLMEVTRRAARVMRQRGEGTIINISSVLGRIGAPFYAAYCSTKFAVEGFSEAIAHELRPFNVHVKIVEPSGTRTEFHHRAYDTDRCHVSGVYHSRYEAKKIAHARGGGGYDSAESIAAIIFRAATDGSWRLRYPAPETAKISLGRRILGDEGLWKVMCKRMGSM
ncbi:SDR family oxidoreductase [Candidatus Peregrinibacteria bacterium]|nr:SDR family oxidoreductase [Candidatus Peregrinibacteria bacterium]MBI3816516.1 SDR family oxidoreductase [Candidatus Peregrinibacteria bacterium]